MPYRRPEEILIAYMQDAIAAERGFETQLRAFAAEADDGRVQRLFAEHEETRAQRERLILACAVENSEIAMYEALA
jgi:ferritin-like metal-binding protein YciE